MKNAWLAVVLTVSVRAMSGQTVIVDPGTWVCGSTPAAFWELTRAAVRKDGSLTKTMNLTHSFALIDGTQVKVLERGAAATKVRVAGQYDPDDRRVHAWPEDRRIGRECWVASEAVK